MLPALALGFGEFEAMDILEACLKGDMQLWVSGDTFVITEIRTYPRMKVCCIILGGGDLGTIRAHIDDMKAWAKERGCSALEAVGRKGWVRALGWDETAVTARKEI